MTKRNLARWMPLAGVMFLTACASSVPAPTMSGGGIIHERNQGYSLLYKLMKDEGQVGKLFIFKSAREPVESLVKEIGIACQSAQKQMEDFAKADKQLGYDTDDLPYIEQRGRDLQASEDEKALLFSSGKDLEIRLLFTQAQAMDYAKQLCKSLEEKEGDPNRKAFLQSLEKQCGDFHDRAMGFLTARD